MSVIVISSPADIFTCSSSRNTYLTAFIIACPHGEAAVSSTLIVTLQRCCPNG